MVRTASSANEEFVRLADPFRGELLALCYRMLGSVHDAEDAVQETYLRAWRSYEGFDGRSSLRTWMHRIATRVCLRALERMSRRPLPSGLGAPSHDPEGPLDPHRLDVPWLQPFPTGLDDPATIVAGRASMRLAFVAALQLLPPRQRVVLILRDVLDWRAAEVATLLETSPAAVNSLTQRARSQLEQAGLGESDVAEPSDADQRVLLEQYAKAFENADIAALMQVLKDDAVWEMPPFATWFTGRQSIGRFLAPRLPAPGDCRMTRTEANGQPAFAFYVQGRAHALQVLTVTRSGIARVVAFMDPEIFATFGLPPLAEGT